MRYEDLKTHIAEVERCQKTHSDKDSPSSPFLRKISQKMKPCNSNAEIANVGALQTTSTPSPSMSDHSPHLHQFRHDLQQQAIPPGFSDSPRPYPQEIFLQGHMEVDRNGKMSSGRTYN